MGQEHRRRYKGTTHGRRFCGAISRPCHHLIWRWGLENCKQRTDLGIGPQFPHRTQGTISAQPRAAEASANRLASA